MPTIQLNYFGYHPYNNPTHSERNVELPLAFWFLKAFESETANVIEVGEVTPFYRRPRHLVYDPAGEKDGTLRQDAVEIDYRGKHLLSISTVEHIGTADYGQKRDEERLPRVLRQMLLSRNYLITFALGYNPQLEKLVRDERYMIFERVAPTRWKQTESRKMEGYKYHSPWYAGNAVCVLTNIEGLQFEFNGGSLPRSIFRWHAPKWSWKDLARAVRQEVFDARNVRRP
jgi:hypothetical protein